MARFLQLLGLIAVLAAAQPAAAQTLDLKAALADRSIGSPDAKLTVIEYASLTCPHCAEFHTQTLPAFKERWIDTGKVRLIFRDFPLDGVALRGSLLARCAPPDRYFGIIDILFRSQDVWARDPDPMRGLGQVARLAGLDQQAFEACLGNQQFLDGLLAMRQSASQQGIKSTPSFVIGGRVVAGALTIEEFAAIIEPMLAGGAAPATVASGPASAAPAAVPGMAGDGIPQWMWAAAVALVAALAAGVVFFVFRRRKAG
ncbi:MAG: DsbA family protein [Alphaproteobacteria bacterium]